MLISNVQKTRYEEIGPGDSAMNGAWKKRGGIDRVNDEELFAHLDFFKFSEARKFFPIKLERSRI
jgi:hypothetical protein